MLFLNDWLDTAETSVKNRTVDKWQHCVVSVCVKKLLTELVTCYYNNYFSAKKSDKPVSFGVKLLHSIWCTWFLSAVHTIHTTYITYLPHVLKLYCAMLVGRGIITSCRHAITAAPIHCFSTPRQQFLRTTEATRRVLPMKVTRLSVIRSSLEWLQCSTKLNRSIVGDLLHYINVIRQVASCGIIGT